jgi:DNA polymerase-4
MRAVTRSATLNFPVATTLTLTEVAERLVRTALTDHPDEAHITLLAISVSNLVDDAVLQLELPFGPPTPDDGAARPGSPVGAARWAVDRSMDDVRRRFGRDAVGYASVAVSASSSVPDAFRELAEHDD